MAGTGDSGKIRVANAPCSFGVIEMEGVESDPIRHEDFLTALRETGYDGTELGDWGFMPTDPSALRRDLDAAGLELVGAFVPVSFADPHGPHGGVGEALKYAELMYDAGFTDAFVVLADDNGARPERTANAGRVTDDLGLSAAEWDSFAAEVTKTAEAVRDRYGLRCVFHHHCAGLVERPKEVAELFGRLDPELIGLCLDAGHWRFAGGDPVAALEEYGDRVWHVHFKDCSAEVAARSRQERWDYYESVAHGVFCELGKGDVDFEEIAAVLRARGYTGWITVEQDVLSGMGQPQDFARRNREFIRDLGI